jgi:hypothetical protein
MKLHDFPKLESPFEREIVNGIYQCVPKIKPEFKWVWSEDCLATDKLDGTNVSVYIESGKIKLIMNRANIIDLWKSDKRFFEGIKNALDRNYFYPEQYNEEQIFGELIGKKLQGNPYNLEEHLWVPFDYLKENYYYKFWSKFIEDECKEKSDEEIFNKTSELFKGLWSIYKRQHNIKSDVNETVVFEGSGAAEGIVFYNKKTEEICKLRRDMFGWYKGRQHETEVEI